MNPVGPPGEVVQVQGKQDAVPGQPGAPTVVQYTTVSITTEPPKDHIIWSLCCFVYANPFCLGLAALIHSVKARDRRVMGDVEGARQYGSTARCLNIWSTALGSVIWFICVIIVIVSSSQTRPPGPRGPRGSPGPDGPAGPAVMCEKDLFDPINKDIEALRNSIAKLNQAMNYGFVRSVGEKYFVSNKERDSFSRAVEFCSQRGLELALPQNQEENDVLTQVLGDVHKTAWIGVNNKRAEGNFASDMKNRPLTFTSWGEGQPDGSIQDTGCTTLSENGVWRVTRDCSSDAYIICQI